MKLPLLVLFTLLLTQTEYTTGLDAKTFLINIAESTSDIKNFVQEKGRRFKKFYVDSFRNKIKPYIGGKNTESTSGTHVERDESTEAIQYYFVQKNPLLLWRLGSRHNIVEENDTNDIGDDEFELSYYDQDPIDHMTTPQLLALNGYPAESHTIVTDDGYLLTLHRIPFPKDSNRTVPKKTVLLHHGLLSSSADWVVTGPANGLAYILSRAGYDVWMANARGNTYSRAHISRQIDSYAFWNFSFHEIAKHDLPAVIDYITALKGGDVKINYIGHSMGTTALFALLSTKPKYNKILRAGFALAPVAYMSKIKSPIRLLARFSNDIAYLIKILGLNEFLPQNAILRWLSEHACEINHYEEAICENSMFVLCGHDPKQFNRTLLPIILGHTPAGASTKTIVHYAQEIKNNGKFQQFDYGYNGNMKQYGKATPPEYPVQNITLPLAFLSAKNDWLASETDVSKLFSKIRNPIEHYIVPLKEFNHLDFLIAIDAPTLVYAKLLQLLNAQN